MGQAKLRGTFEQRKAGAVAKAEIEAPILAAAERAKFPESITCQHCATVLTNIKSIPVDITGLDLVGGAMCPNCSRATYFAHGTKAALQAFQAWATKNPAGDAKFSMLPDTWGQAAEEVASEEVSA